MQGISYPELKKKKKTNKKHEIYLFSSDHNPQTMQ